MEKYTQYNPKDVYLFAMNGNLNELEIALNQDNNNIENIYKDDYGRSALHMCVINNHIDIIDKLIDAGMDINDKDNDHHTALHLALKYSNRNCIKKLLDTGAHNDDYDDNNINKDTSYESDNHNYHKIGTTDQPYEQQKESIGEV